MKYKLDHIGYLTGNISETSRYFEILGYVAEKTVNDDTQQTKICFLKKEGEPTIELVEPYEGNKSMQKMFAKKGVTPYHMCYEVRDIEAAVNHLRGQRFLLVNGPVPACAMGDRRIAFLFQKNTGLIELVEAQPR